MVIYEKSQLYEFLSGFEHSKPFFFHSNWYQLTVETTGYQRICLWVIETYRKLRNVIIVNVSPGQVILGGDGILVKIHFFSKNKFFPKIVQKVSGNVPRHFLDNFRKTFIFSKKLDFFPKYRPPPPRITCPGETLH